jgi:hypothetical protein
MSAELENKFNLLALEALELHLSLADMSINERNSAQGIAKKVNLMNLMKRQRDLVIEMATFQVRLEFADAP